MLDVGKMAQNQGIIRTPHTTTSAVEIARPVTLYIAIWFKMLASLEAAPLRAMNMVGIFDPLIFTTLLLFFAGATYGDPVTGVLRVPAHASWAEEL